MVKGVIGLGLLLFLPVGCESKGSAANPLVLPEEAVGKLEGTAGVVDGGRASADIYNGTDWIVVDVDMSVAKVSTGESRRVRLTCVREVFEPYEPVAGVSIDKKSEVTSELLPYSSGKFIGTSGSFFDGLKKEEKSYTIVGARGYRK